LGIQEKECQRKYEREGEKKTESDYFMRKVQAIRADGRAEL